MKIVALLLFSIVPLIQQVVSQRIVSWYTPNTDFTPDHLDWNIYTHIRFGEVGVFPNGTNYCNKDAIPLYEEVMERAQKSNTKILTGPNISIYPLMTNASWGDYLNNYLDSINTTLNNCNFDGISIDYEFGSTFFEKLGIVTEKETIEYSSFLATLKKSMNDRLISADIGVWGFQHGDYPLLIRPWVTKEVLNSGAVDWVDTMSYHYSKSGSILQWKKDIFWLHNLWGIDKSRINLGIGLFSHRGNSEPTNHAICKMCPNITANDTICENITFVSTNMAQQIGSYVAENKIGGVFPWASNYDCFIPELRLSRAIYRGFS